MKKLKIVLICLIFLLPCFSLSANSVYIKVKINNDIITNIDIENEIKYLTFLNPKLEKLQIKKINEIAKNSLITEIIKKEEIEKLYNLEISDKLTDILEKNFIRTKNISSIEEFKLILENKNLDYRIVKYKLKIETLWNQLIYKKYIKNVKIDKNYLRKQILTQFKNENKKYEYSLSEIFFAEGVNENIEEAHKKLKKSISEIGFENTANIYSKSNTSKNGGLIGWINELQINEGIKNEILKLSNGEISKPIKIQGGYLLIKLNNKREFKQKIDIEKQLTQLVNKETNRQLNAFSIIFYKKLKKNILINEL